jgi:hypothetical protein
MTPRHSARDSTGRDARRACAQPSASGLTRHGALARTARCTTRGRFRAVRDPLSAPRLRGLAIARSWGFESPFRTNNLRRFSGSVCGQLVKCLVKSERRRAVPEGAVIAFREVGGWHYRYERRAA